MNVLTVLIRMTFLSVFLYTAVLLSGAAPAVHADTNAAAPLEKPAAPGQQPAASKWFVPLTVGDHFSCEIPADWSRDDHPFGLSQEEKKVYGITLIRPMPEAVPLRISVYYYAEGNLLYASRDQFITWHSRPVLGLAEGDQYGAKTEIIVSGRQATTFDRRKNEFVPMQGLRDEPDQDDGRVYESGEMMARLVPVMERFLVVPAATGFYVLSYHAPTEVFREFLGKFERVMATFNPLR